MDLDITLLVMYTRRTMKTLTTACGTAFTVDEETWEWAREEKWFLRNGYPCRYEGGSGYGAKDGREFTLHRELMEFPLAVVHHRDGNPLNCCRRNLEVVSAAEHARIHETGK